MSAIKELREKTGTGMMDCKVTIAASPNYWTTEYLTDHLQAALEETGGNIEDAYEVRQSATTTAYC